MKTELTHLLVVDDEHHNFFLYKELLAPYNIYLSYAASGKEAIAKCEKDTKISLILMDLKMEGMNGFDAALKIKSKRPGMALIVQTAYANDFRKDILMMNVFDGFLEKPVRKQALMDELSKHIQLQPLEKSPDVLKPAKVRNFLNSLFMMAFMFTTISSMAQYSSGYLSSVNDLNRVEPITPNTILGSSAIDSVLLLDGKYLLGHYLSWENNTVNFLRHKKNGEKLCTIAAENIFDVKFANGSMRYFYSCDSTAGDVMSLDQMQNYLDGVSVCRKEFKAPIVFAGGMVIGAATPLISFWLTPSVFLYSLSVRSVPHPKPFSMAAEDIFYEQQRNYHFRIDYSQECSIRKEMTEYNKSRMDSYDKNNSKDKEFEKLYYFTEGYNAQAKKKKPMNALWGGSLGFIATSLAIIILCK
jgi:CheY-like chemotaxis protein